MHACTCFMADMYMVYMVNIMFDESMNMHIISDHVAIIILPN